MSCYSCCLYSTILSTESETHPDTVLYVLGMIYRHTLLVSSAFVVLPFHHTFCASLSFHSPSRTSSYQTTHGSRQRWGILLTLGVILVMGYRGSFEGKVEEDDIIDYQWSILLTSCCVPKVSELILLFPMYLYHFCHVPQWIKCPYDRKVIITLSSPPRLSIPLVFKYKHTWL